MDIVPAASVDAFKRDDVDALVPLLHEDAILAMPPFELWLQGQAHIRRFLMAMQSEGGRDHVVPLAANGSPAMAIYRPTGSPGTLEAFSIHVLEAVDGRIARLHAFMDPGLFLIFGDPDRMANTRG